MPRRNHVVIAHRFVLRNLFRKPSGQWAAKIRDLETGRVRERSSRARTRVQAFEEIRSWLEAVAVVEDGGTVGVPFSHALEEFLRLKDVREPTRQFYSKLSESLLDTFGQRLTTDVRLADVEEYAEARRERGNSPRTVSMYIGLLRSLYRWARRRGYADHDPTDGLRIAASRRAGRALSVGEARRFLEAAVGARHLELWILIGLYTGLRSRNVREMTWRHVDLEKRSISFGDEEMKRRGIRIPIHPVLERELRRELAGQKVVDPAGRVVPDVDPRKAWQKALRRAKIGHLRPHDLRHTFGTWIALRASYAVQQALLGHAPQTVTDAYAHAPWPALVRAVRQLPDITRPARKGAKLAEGS